MAAELAALGRGDPRALSADRRARTRRPYKTCRAALRADPGAGASERRDRRGQGPGRETAILADRCDIAEEIVRLRAHLTQFHEIIDEPESAGRKLEFVTQEIGREINTIGSKASDVQISRSVVEVKALLEKIRELVQNVE